MFGKAGLDRGGYLLFGLAPAALLLHKQPSSQSGGASFRVEAGEPLIERDCLSMRHEKPLLPWRTSV
jgi:hypothetical protein